MREIKFRGKSTLTEDRLNELDMNHDNGWVTGFLVMSGSVPYIIGEIIDSDESYISPEFWTPVHPETVGQFTGLKDKNGKEIYEGDLLSDPYPIDEDDLSKGYHESLLPVIWCNVKLQWCVDTSFAKDGSFLFSLVEYFGNSLEVKGNVFEKGEVL